jgi:hypothetical protein
MKIFKKIASCLFGLAIASNIFAAPIDSGNVGQDTYTTTSTQLGKLSDTATFTINSSSLKGTGLPSTYQTRALTWYVQYSQDNVNFTSSTPKVIDLASSSLFQDSATVNFGSKANWYTRVVFSLADKANSTYLVNPQYVERSRNATLSSGNPTNLNVVKPSSGSGFNQITIPFSTPALPPGAIAISGTYSYTVSEIIEASITVTGSAGWNYAFSFTTPASQPLGCSPSKSKSTSDAIALGAQVGGSSSCSFTSYASSGSLASLLNNLFVYGIFSGTNNVYGNVYISISNPTLVIKYKELTGAATSTTPTNRFIVTDIASDGNPLFSPAILLLLLN